MRVTLRIDGRNSTADADANEYAKAVAVIQSAKHSGLIREGSTLYMPRHAAGLGTLSYRKPPAREYWQAET